MNDLLHICQLSHGAYVNESWHTYARVMARMNLSRYTYEWVMVHVWMSHGTRMNESWYTYEWVTLHVWMSHGTRVNESWYTCEWVTAHTWGKPGMCQLIVSRTNSVLRQYVGSLLPGEWMRIMTHSYVYHDFPICVPWLIRMYAQSHQTAMVVTLHMWLSHGTRVNESQHTYEGTMAYANELCHV